MSSLNTTNLNINLKAQQLTGKKALQDSAQAAGNIGFENLFANALSQRSNPQAKLSQINEELQEALGGNTSRHSESNKKAFKATENTNPDSNAYGMAGSTLAQANMWAQRDWAQSSKSESAVASSNTPSANSMNAPNGPNAASSSKSEATAKAESGSAEKAGDKPATDAAKPPSVQASDKAPSDTDSTASANSQAQSNTNAATTAASDQTQGAATAVDGKQATQDANTSGLAGQATVTTAEAGTLTGNLDVSTAALATDSTVAQASTASPSSTDASLSASPLSDSRGGVASPSLEANKDAQATEPNARTSAELKADQTNGNRTETLKTALEPAANGPTNQATRPEVAQAAAAMQAAQTGGKARGLKAGDEILTTAATGSSSSGGASGSTASTQAQAGIGLATLATGRTGSAAEATIKTPVNQPGFVKELGAQVQWAVGKNLSTVDIRLTAGQLGGDAGNMNLRIIQRGQDIQLLIRTQDEATTTLLNQTVAGLKESLAQNGLQLSQVQIQTGNGQNQAGSSNPFNTQQQAQQQAGQSGQNPGGQSGRQGNPQGNPGQDSPVAPSEPVRRNRSNGNIDLVA